MACCVCGAVIASRTGHALKDLLPGSISMTGVGMLRQVLSPCSPASYERFDRPGARCCSDCHDLLARAHDLYVEYREASDLVRRLCLEDDEEVDGGSGPSGAREDGRNVRTVSVRKLEASSVEDQVHKFVRGLLPGNLDLREHLTRILDPQFGPGRTCRLCGSPVATHAALSSHFSHSHPGSSPFKCRSCGRLFPSRALFLAHQREEVLDLVSRNRGWFDPKVMAGFGYDFGGSVLPRRSPRIRQAPPEFSCSSCCSGFPTAASLRVHLVRAHSADSRGFKCGSCSQSFAGEASLEIHRASFHASTKPKARLRGGRKSLDEPKAECRFCSQKYTGPGSKNNLRTHLWMFHKITSK